MCLLCLSALGQTRTIDSLKLLLPYSENTTRYQILFGLAYELFDVDNVKALELSSESYELAKHLGDTIAIVKSGRINGQLLRRNDRLDDAIKVLSEILPIAHRNRMVDEEKSILNALAIAYTFIADYDKALKCHFQSLIIREEEGNKQEISVTLNNIGLVYFKLGNFQEALQYYKRSLQLREEANETYDLDRLLINIGLCFNQLKKFDEAQQYIDRALKICNDRCADEILIEGYCGLGVTNSAKGEFSVALDHFKKSLTISRKVDNKRFQAENLVCMAKIYIKTSENQLAAQVLNEAESIASAAGYNEPLIDTYRQFSTLFTNLNDFEKATIYQNRYINLKDSIYSEQLIDNIAKIQSDFAERENIATIAAKEEVIKQQRDLNIAIAIIAMLAGLLVLVLQRSNRTIKRVNAQLSEAKEVIEEQNKLLEDKNKYLDKEVEAKTVDLERVNQSLKQVNDELDNFIYKTSHDIRGPLASLKGMCNVALMDVKDPVALDYLSKLDTTAERLNTILTRLLIINQINNSKLSVARIDFDTIINDVLLLEKKKGLPQKLKIRRYVEDNATILSDKELIRIVLENLIDNAIKFYNESDRVDSFVDIHVNTSGQGQVRVRVIDNGIGISEANPGKLFRMFFRASERSETGGIGLYIVKTATAKLGGRVGLLTTPEGYTEFYVLFPTTPPKQDDDSEKPSI